MVRILKIISLILFSTQLIFSQTKPLVTVNDNSLKAVPNDTILYLNIPDRPENAIDGSAFASQVTSLSLDDRERAVVREILSGNVPSFSRKLRPLTIHQMINGKRDTLTFFTVCDYMAIGSDQDYLYIPMTPSTAQYLADSLNTSLPTKKMVDIIYNKAEIKLRPQPIPPSDKMTTVPVFMQHTDSIKQQMAQIGLDRTADHIIAGHKKDIIISNKIYSPDRNYDRVVIYGWHLSENNPIQPVYNGHIAKYADYSHGVRLISNMAFLNGDSIQTDKILKDPDLSILLSDEGVINKAYYPESDLFTSIESPFQHAQIDFKLKQNYPNPFNSSTTIIFKTQNESRISLNLYNALGQKIQAVYSGNIASGTHRVKLDSKNISSGVYYYELIMGRNRIVKKCIVLK